MRQLYLPLTRILIAVLFFFLIKYSPEFFWPLYFNVYEIKSFSKVLNYFLNMNFGWFVLFLANGFHNSSLDFCLLILVINFFFSAWAINNILIVIFPLAFVPLNTSNCKYAGHTGFNCNNLYICSLWRVPVHKDFSGCYEIGQTVTCSRNGIFEELHTWSSSFSACKPLTFTVTTTVELLAVKAGADLKRGGWKFATNPDLLSKSQQIFLNNAQYSSSWLISRFLKKKKMSSLFRRPGSLANAFIWSERKKQKP